VTNQLGDDVRVVLKVYAHRLPGRKKDEVNALDDTEYLHRTAPYMHPTTKKDLAVND